MSEQPTVLVTGATGRVGGQLVRQLQGSRLAVRALARDPARASPRLGDHVDVVGGDLGRPDSLTGALDGVDSVFLVFPTVAADTAARELITTIAGLARRIVYLSAHGVPDEPDPHAVPDGSIMGSHAHLEGLITASGAEYAFLRASGFAANTLAWAGQLRQGDVLHWIYPEARRALVHEADLAAVAARALTEDGQLRIAYHLTGPQQLTQAEQLAAIGAALGRSLRFEEIDPADAQTTLFPGMPAEAAAGIIRAHAAFVTRPEPVTGTIGKLTGRPARSFAQWAREHAADFRPQGP